MGYETVKHMSVAEFEVNWAIQQAVIRATRDREGAEHDANLRRTLALDEAGRLDTPVVLPLDPATASPEEIARWMSANGY